MLHDRMCCSNVIQLFPDEPICAMDDHLGTVENLTRSLTLQSSEERRTGAARPSLLTPAQQAEADRNRILTKLEHGNAQPPTPAHPRGKALAWGASGVAALALLGGAAFWMGGEPATPAVVAAASVAPPAARAAAPASVPAATIQDEPAPLVLASPAPKAEAAAKPGADDLRDALEEGTGDKKPPASKPVDSPVKKPVKPMVKAEAKPAVKPPVKAAPRKSTEHDSDLALLSALVAHTQASRARDDGLRALRKELKACTRLKGSKARDCREEACLGQDRSVKECR